VDLVINLDPIPIDFWHRRFPKRVPRGLILAIHSALETGFEIADQHRAIFSRHGPEPAAGRAQPQYSFNFYNQQYTGIQDAP
jgi:hypothetical protein